VHAWTDGLVDQLCSKQCYKTVHLFLQLEALSIVCVDVPFLIYHLIDICDIVLIKTTQTTQHKYFSFKKPWRHSISRPIALVSSVALRD
jgi:hypothetical protein